jgi:abhydrolase domain-containing protein 6
LNARYISLVLLAAILTGFAVWAVFYSNAKSIGKLLYELNNKIEAKSAKLVKVIIQHNGKELIYLTNNKANKPIMVLLHGFSADKDIWYKFAKLAVRDFNVVIPDLLGHGDLPYQASQSYSTHNQSMYIQALIEYKGLQFPGQPFVVVGNSMGGMITAELLQGWDKGSIANLDLKLAVLLDPAGALTDFAKTMAQSKHNPFVHLTLPSFFSLYKNTMYRPPFMPPSVLHYIGQTNYLDKKAQYEHMFMDFFDIDTFYETPLPFKEAKPLIIWGEKDGLLPVADANKWQHLLGVEPIILKDTGHMPMVECPQKTYELIINAYLKT